MPKDTRTYWYNYADINNLLQTKSNNSELYFVADTASQNSEQALQRINQAFTALEQNPDLPAAVIPINLGNSVDGIYEGAHWVGLAIRRNPETDALEAFYNDSLGTPMDTSLPDLKRILNNHGIPDGRIVDLQQVQQNNGYDCGPLTVLNLDSLARTGSLPEDTNRLVVEQRRNNFGYVLRDNEIGNNAVTNKSEHIGGDLHSLIHEHIPNSSINSIIHGYLNEGRMEIVFAGHRGYGATQVQYQRDSRTRFPENSLISLQEVIRSGAQAIEFDLYLSSDKRLMVTHDDDLSKNARYIVQRDNHMAKPSNQGGGFYPKGQSVQFTPSQETFVSKRTYTELRRDFDISNGLPIPSDCPSEAQYLYKRMPEFTEVLQLVSLENARREDLGLPRVKLNVELKGVGTGEFVQKAIEEFNLSKKPADKIQQNEIFYISFLDRELATVAGLIPGSTGAAVPDANLILGVPTSMQYSKVGKDYEIEDSALNIHELEKGVRPLHIALQKLPGREGKGLSGVDMSLWDVGPNTINYFSKDLKTPIHIAVVPFERGDLTADHIRPALFNIRKIAAAQEEHLGGEHTMIVKTDNPKLLQTMVQEELLLSHTVIENPMIRSRKTSIVSKKEIDVGESTITTKKQKIKEELNSPNLTLHPKPTAALAMQMREALEKREAEIPAPTIMLNKEKDPKVDSGRGSP